MFRFLCDDPECDCRENIEKMLNGMVVARRTAALCLPSRVQPLTLKENVEIAFNIPDNLGGGELKFTSHEIKEDQPIPIPVEDEDVFSLPRLREEMK